MSCTASLGKEFNVVSPREVPLSTPSDRASTVMLYMYGNNRYCIKANPAMGIMCDPRRFRQAFPVRTLPQTGL